VATRDRPVIFRVAVGVLILAALGLSACGRKGALEPPPSAQATDNSATMTAKPAPKPARHFFLDPLI
jgi:predicted small lipoprotein YifL